MSSVGDRLLAVVSARQRLTWEAFRQAFDVLHARALHAGVGIGEAVPYVRLKSLRLLSELAHSEIPPYGTSTAVSAAPSVLARLPVSGLPTATLCGSRGSGTVAALRAACSELGDGARVVTLSQPFSGGYAPTAVRVEATDEPLLERVATTAGIRFAAYPPAWAILRYSASLADYDAQLVWTSDPDPAWPRKDFDAATLTFGFEHIESAARLSSFQDPLTRRQIHRLWRNGLATTVDRSWGRWLYLRDIEAQVLRFDRRRQTATVPATVPLPGLLGRSLALFSGLSPHQGSQSRGAEPSADYYGAVPLEAAEVLAAKLQQPLLEEAT